MKQNHYRLRMLIRLYIVHSFYKNSEALHEVCEHITSELDFIQQ